MGVDAARKPGAPIWETVWPLLHSIAQEARSNLSLVVMVRRGSSSPRATGCGTGSRLRVSWVAHYRSLARVWFVPDLPRHRQASRLWSHLEVGSPATRLSPVLCSRSPCLTDKPCVSSSVPEPPIRSTQPPVRLQSSKSSTHPGYAGDRLLTSFSSRNSSGSSTMSLVSRFSSS